MGKGSIKVGPPGLKCIFIFAALAVLCAGRLSAQDDPQSIVRFIRYLAAQGEHYRANVEMKRLKSFYPDFLSPLKYSVSQYYLLYMGQQYKTVLSMKKPGQGRMKYIDLLFRCDIFSKRHDYKNSLGLVASIPADADSRTASFLLKRKLFSLMMLGKFNDAESAMTGTQAYDSSSYRELVHNARYSAGHLRKPWAAALLGIVPGMGYIYGGDLETGLVTFLIVSIHVVASFFAFRTGNDVIGYLAGVTGGLFYAGSIFGGYMSVVKYNRMMRRKMHERLSVEMNLQDDREFIYNRYGIGTGKAD